MDMVRPIQLLPTLPMLQDALIQANWQCQMFLSHDSQSYRSVRLYHSRQVLHKDVLYLLRPTERDFPFDEYSYISSVPLPGTANHLVCSQHPDEEILDQLLEVFSTYREWGERIDLLLYRNASLQELCELGSQLLENPVCIHDDWFVMMAMTADFARIMEPEYLTASTQGFVPRAVIEDFQTDSEYLETYGHRNAQIWYSPERNQHSLYVNLWDGPVYRGRLLVAPKNRDFKPRDYLLAEAITQRATLLLRRKQPGGEEPQVNMDNIVFGLLRGNRTDPAELAHLLNMLRWQEGEQYLCLRLRHQGSSTVVGEHLLHSDLLRCFPGCYVLLSRQEQCVIINLHQKQTDFAQLHHKIAPLCRDYCLYAGVSAPVEGIRELRAAYYQAGAALDQAARQQNEKWILDFSDCAVEHMLRNLPSPLAPGHLVVPELRRLIAYDQENNTPYFQTLREYLIQERDIPRTSAALIIHRTTLLYRLKKIRDLISVDLEDPWQRMHLMLSLWILENKL